MLSDTTKTPNSFNLKSERVCRSKVKKNGTLESTGGEKVSRLCRASEDSEPLLRLGAKNVEFREGRRGLKEAKLVVVMVVEER